MQPIEDLFVLETLDRDIVTVLGLYARAAESPDGEMSIIAADRIAIHRRMRQSIAQRFQALPRDHPHTPLLSDAPLVSEGSHIAALPVNEGFNSASITAAENTLSEQLRFALTRHVTLETYAMLTDFLGDIERLPANAEPVLS